MFRKQTLFVFLLAVIGLGIIRSDADEIPSSTAAKAAKPNILLILVDDLKPAIGSYGDTNAITPNIDKLASRSMRFDKAYCNQAVCAPSRFTLLLGSHSTSTGLYGLGSQLRKVIPNAVTLPQYFAQHGYRTESLGKVFHIGHGNIGDPESFSVPHFEDKVIEYVSAESTDGGKLTREEAYFTNQKLAQIRSLPKGAAYESPDVTDESYADGRVAEETIRRLNAAKRRREKDQTPFFIAAGFVRPHLPFSAPKKYWDMHDPKTLPMPKFEKHPADAVKMGLKLNGEIANYKPVERGKQIDGDLKRNLIHGYYASTSFVDTQIGKVIAELDRLEMSNETIVVLWGDHGFHLGDHRFWTKHSNYEQANRIPILIHAPGVTKPGSSTGQLTESVDIFPTLAELCGLPTPTGPQPIDGKSLVPVLKFPSTRIRDHAFHCYPKQKLGRAIRTDRYRLVEWSNGKDDKSIEYELFDYRDDPLETKNHAKLYPDVLEKMKSILNRYPTPYSKAKQNQKSTPRKALSPKIANRPLEISAKVDSKKPNGVVLAQGGREHGYAIHFIDGLAAFDVRINGTVTRVLAKDKVSGRLEILATLTKQHQTLSINGIEVAKRISSGLIPVEPKDELSIGFDDLSAAGAYEAPNRFLGKVISTQVKQLLN
ncbi:sulfatase [Pirellulaceae bacterium]|nr:sulfatase [Pirellulaceae bacterium]